MYTICGTDCILLVLTLCTLAAGKCLSLCYLFIRQRTIFAIKLKVIQNLILKLTTVKTKHDLCMHMNSLLILSLETPWDAL